MNLKGGYKIINLMTLSLVAVTTGLYTDITDKVVLEQLLSLRDLLDTSKELKPILLRLGQSKNEVVMAELSRDSAGLHIHALLDGYTLDIKVTYQVDEDTQEVLIDDAQYLYIENSAQEEAVIKGLIEADKDILSKIIYSNVDDILTFPKGILPIKYHNANNDADYYFDYYNGAVVDATNQNVAELGITNLQVRIIDMAGNVGIFDKNNDGISYILNDELVETELNAYYLYHPITSAGVKLYKHIVSLTTTIGVSNITFISTHSNAITDFTETIINSIVQYVNIGSSLTIANQIAFRLSYFGGNAPHVTVLRFELNTDDGTVTKYSANATAISGDIVTEL